MAPIDDDNMTISDSDVVSLATPTIDVTCDSCGHVAQISDHPVAGHEQRWKCNCAASFVIVNGEKQPTKDSGLCDCSAENVIPGDVDGEPGEAVLNAAATAVSDDDLAEAAGRRLSDEQIEEIVAARGGTIHKIEVGGSVGSNGESTGGKV